MNASYISNITETFQGISFARSFFLSISDYRTRLQGQFNPGRTGMSQGLLLEETTSAINQFYVVSGQSAPISAFQQFSLYFAAIGSQYIAQTESSHIPDPLKQFFHLLNDSIKDLAFLTNCVVLIAFWQTGHTFIVAGAALVLSVEGFRQARLLSKKTHDVIDDVLKAIANISRILSPGSTAAEKVFNGSLVFLWLCECSESLCYKFPAQARAVEALSLKLFALIPFADLRQWSIDYTTATYLPFHREDRPTPLNAETLEKLFKNELELEVNLGHMDYPTPLFAMTSVQEQELNAVNIDEIKEFVKTVDWNLEENKEALLAELQDDTRWKKLHEGKKEPTAFLIEQVNELVEKAKKGTLVDHTISGAEDVLPLMKKITLNLKAYAENGRTSEYRNTLIYLGMLNGYCDEALIDRLRFIAQGEIRIVSNSPELAEQLKKRILLQLEASRKGYFDTMYAQIKAMYEQQPKGSRGLAFVFNVLHPPEDTHTYLFFYESLRKIFALPANLASERLGLPEFYYPIILCSLSIEIDVFNICSQSEHLRLEEIKNLFQYDDSISKIAISKWINKWISDHVKDENRREHLLEEFEMDTTLFGKQVFGNTKEEKVKMAVLRWILIECGVLRIKDGS